MGKSHRNLQRSLWKIPVTSDGLVSVFEVGICFSYVLKSIRYSVSVFQDIAISISVFGIFHVCFKPGVAYVQARGAPRRYAPYCRM